MKHCWHNINVLKGKGPYAHQELVLSRMCIHLSERSRRHVPPRGGGEGGGTARAAGLLQTVCAFLWLQMQQWQANLVDSVCKDQIEQPNLLKTFKHQVGLQQPGFSERRYHLEAGEARGSGQIAGLALLEAQGAEAAPALLRHRCNPAQCAPGLTVVQWYEGGGGGGGKLTCNNGN